MQITCPACSKTSETKADVSGRSVKCGCGNTFTVPASKPSSTDKVLVTCECGKRLNAPASAAGKQVKCSCGKAVRVPGGDTASATAPKPAAPSAAAAKAASAPAKPAPAKAAPAPANAPTNAFAGMDDDEWSSLVAQHAPKPVEEKSSEKKSATAVMLQRAGAEVGQDKSSQKDGAVKHLSKARWILVGIGVLHLALCLFVFFTIDKALEAPAGGIGDVEIDIEERRFALQLVSGIGIGISVGFILMGALVFQFPMTCTVTATVIYVSLQVFSLIMDPFSLMNPRVWIARVMIIGALIQGINSAAYYKFVKAESKEKKK